MKKIIVFLFFTLLINPAFAEEIDADEAIKYRKGVMSAIKGHNVAIKSIITGKVPFTNRLDSHLDAMQQLFDELDYIFPEGSDFGKTNAKEEIWDKPEQFKKAIADAKASLNAFRTVIQKQNNSYRVGAFKEFGKTSCGGCHKYFKKKNR